MEFRAPLPTPSYQPKRKGLLATNLPRNLMMPELDLTLLPGGVVLLSQLTPKGDLNNETERTQVVSNISQCIRQQDKFGYADVNVLLGASGVGKTKAIHDLSTEHFTIYLNSAAHQKGEEDIGEMLSKIRMIEAERV
jgi:hypothetical protein